MEESAGLRLTYDNPLGSDPITKLLMRYAMPSVIAMLVNSLYNIVDQIFIGQGVGYLGNGATTVVSPLVTIAIGLGTLVGAGGSAYAAIKLGEKRVDTAELVLGNVVSLSAVIGVIFMLAVFLFFEPILRAFGATPEIMPYAKEYGAVILVGLPFQMLGIGLGNLARTDGNPRISMISMVVGAALNTVLDPVYIFIFHWGVFGAAIATISSQIITFVILCYYFLKKSNMQLRVRNLRPRLHLDLDFCALGISSFFTQVSICFLQIVLNNALVHYGDLDPIGGNVALTAMGVVMKVNLILVSICVGVGTGAQPILGFNRGARQWRRVRSAYLQAVVFATVCSVAGWLACMLIPDVILSLFGSDNINFTNFAVLSMRIYLSGVFVCGFQIVSTSYFQATGQPLKATVLSLLRQFLLRIPMILVFPLFWGLRGILYSGPASDVGAAAIVAVFIVKEMKWLTKQAEECAIASENLQKNTTEA